MQRIECFTIGCPILLPDVLVTQSFQYLLLNMCKYMKVEKKTEFFQIRKHVAVVTVVN